ncbi:plexin domain-containing protein 2-like [Argonauta hians]
MAALPECCCSRHGVFLVQICLFVAIPYLTNAVADYSLTFNPSRPVSEIQFRYLYLKRSRRDVKTSSPQPTTTKTTTTVSSPPNSSRVTQTYAVSSNLTTPRLDPTLTTTKKVTQVTTKITPKPTTVSTTPTTTASKTFPSKPSTPSLPKTTPLTQLITTKSSSTTFIRTTIPPPSKPPLTSTTMKGVTTPLTKVIEDNHEYYLSKIIQNGLDDHWIDLDKMNFIHHKELSKNHRLAAPVKLNFKFRFFGHQVVNLTIATGGFLYMSPFLHKWLTATQYIAPLMANFDTTFGKDSEVRILDTKDMFVVHWKNVYLHDVVFKTNNSFNFQVILKKDGSIKFIYKQLPILPTSISSQQHPVKIGLSDAYYIDTKGSSGIIRIIYEYHRVSIDMKTIRPNTVVILTPLPTCNLAEDCQTCFSQKSNFSCNWCSAVNRCSNGIDWHRQSWIKNKCIQTSNGSKVCPSKPIPVAAIIIAIIVLAVCFGLGIWCYHGYTHPTSTLGIWLMENRPSQMKAKMANMKFWKQSTPAGDKYCIESDA